MVDDEGLADVCSGFGVPLGEAKADAAGFGDGVECGHTEGDTCWLCYDHRVYLLCGCLLHLGLFDVAEGHGLAILDDHLPGFIRDLKRESFRLLCGKWSKKDPAEGHHVLVVHDHVAIVSYHEIDLLRVLHLAILADLVDAIEGAGGQRPVFKPGLGRRRDFNRAPTFDIHRKHKN